MTHATNEQMALVMGWYKEQVWWFVNGEYAGFTNEDAGKGSRIFQPTTDLNHAALVEARVYQLGLVVGYMEQLLSMTGIDLDAYYEADAHTIYGIATATAQTRCDAAWAAYQAWKEQAT